MRILVACVGNMLRRDDGFGQAVAARLQALPAGVTMVETGIGGIDLLHELMLGYDGLVVVDAVERGVEPGTVFVITPEVDAAEAHVPDVHLANPQRVLSMAKALNCLPLRVRIVGCQPGDDGLGESLTPAVERAVDVAVASLMEVLGGWITSHTGEPSLPRQQVDVSGQTSNFQGPA